MGQQARPGQLQRPPGVYPLQLLFVMLRLAVSRIDQLKGLAPPATPSQLRRRSKLTSWPSWLTASSSRYVSVSWPATRSRDNFKPLWPSRLSESGPRTDAAGGMYVEAIQQGYQPFTSSRATFMPGRRAGCLRTADPPVPPPPSRAAGAGCCDGRTSDFPSWSLVLVPPGPGAPAR